MASTINTLSQMAQSSAPSPAMARLDAMFPDLAFVKPATGYNSNLTFGSTSSSGPNPGGTDLSQAGGGGAGAAYMDSLSGGGGAGLMEAAMFLPAITGLLGVIGDVDTHKQEGKAVRKQIARHSERLAYSQSKRAQQLQDLDRVFSDKLSASGLEALKAESRLKASAAETGTISNTGSTSVAINQAGVNELHRNAMILRTADVKKANALQELVGERMNFEYALQDINSGQASGRSMLLGAFNSTIGSMMGGLDFLNQSQKSGLFQTNTTGEA